MSPAKETLLDQNYTLPPISNKSGRKNILKFVIPVTLLICFATFALGLHLGFALHPREVKVYIVKAGIKSFEIVSNDTIHSKIELAMVFKNPNKFTKVHYKRVHVSGFYQENKLGCYMVPKFHQGGDSADIFYPVFEGKTRVSENWKAEKGFMDVEVRGHALVKYKFGCFKTKKMRVKIMCAIDRIALDGKAISGFRRTICDVGMYD